MMYFVPEHLSSVMNLYDILVYRLIRFFYISSCNYLNTHDDHVELCSNKDMYKLQCKEY